MSVFVLLLFGFGVVSAAVCGDADDIIMKLSAPTNAHVAEASYGGAGYADEICYDTIFGGSGSGDYTCASDGSNRVLSLSATFNAHASNDETDAAYPEDVCYEGLECVYDSSGGNDCSNTNDGEIVVRMSALTNAHVSDASDTSYPVKVCCTSGPYWADMYGNKISNADAGDRVYMIYPGGSSETFDVREDDGLPFGLGDDIIISGISGSIIDGKYTGVWEITGDNLANTVDLDEFYFEVDGEVSDYLVIGPEDDDPVEIVFETPSCGSRFDEGDSALIRISASDDDDEITGSLKVDGNEIGAFRNGVSEFTHELPLGDVQMIAEGSNSRGYRFKVYSNVMVLRMSDGINYDDGDYVAACILKPENFQDIDGVVVDFDASNTKGIRVTGGNAVDFSPDGNAGENIFSWVWRFFKPDGSEFASSPYEALNSVDSSSYIFSRVFPAAGDNSASLTVELGS